MMHATRPDPFATFYHTAHQARRWRWACAGLGVVLVAQMAVIALLALQPPWVVVKDRIDGTPPALQRLRSDPTVNLADARLFFTHMSQLRYGWTSTTVLRDLEDFLRQCYPPHRTVQLRHLQASEQAMAKARSSGAAVPSAAISRLRSWSEGKIVNRLLLPSATEDVHCHLRANEPVWDCAMAIVLRAELAASAGPHKGAPASHEQRGTLVASLVEVPHTGKTPAGLLLAHLDLVPAAPSAQTQEE